MLCNRQKENPQIKWLSADLIRDPGGIQTHDLQNRNLTLYSAKLPSPIFDGTKVGIISLQTKCNWIFICESPQRVGEEKRILPKVKFIEYVGKLGNIRDILYL